MKITLKSEYSKVSSDFSDEVNIKDLMKGFITLAVAQGYHPVSVYNAMRDILNEQEEDGWTTDKETIKPLLEEEPMWKNGCAIFRFEDGSAMARFAGEPIVEIHRNRKRPVSLSFTKDFLAFITTEEEKELYDRWVISCHQALGKIPNEVCHAY